MKYIGKSGEYNIGLNKQGQKVPFKDSLDDLVNMIKIQESGGRDYDENGKPIENKGAKYSMQVRKSTAESPGFDIQPAQEDSPEEYNRVGKEYLSALVDKYGNTRKAIAAYNHGPGAIDKLIKSHGKNWEDYLFEGPGEADYLDNFDKIKKSYYSQKDFRQKEQESLNKLKEMPDYLKPSEQDFKEQNVKSDILGQQDISSGRQLAYEDSERMLGRQPVVPSAQRNIISREDYLANSNPDIPTSLKQNVQPMTVTSAPGAPNIINELTFNPKNTDFIGKANYSGQDTREFKGLSDQPQAQIPQEMLQQNPYLNPSSGPQQQGSPSGLLPNQQANQQINQYGNTPEMQAQADAAKQSADAQLQQVSQVEPDTFAKDYALRKQQQLAQGQQLDPYQMMQEGFKEKLAGMESGAKAEADSAKAQADYYNFLQQQKQSMLDKDSALQQLNQKYLDQANQMMTNRDNALRSYEDSVNHFAQQSMIDPNRVWNNASNMDKLSAGIAIALGAGAQAMWGTPNQAMNMFNNIIDRDINSQKVAFEKERVLIGMKQNIYGMYRDQFQDETMAYNAAKSTMIQNLQMQIESQMAGTNSLIAKNNASLIMSQLDQQKADLKMQMGQNLMQMMATNSYMSGDANPNMIGFLPEKLREDAMKTIVNLPDGTKAFAINPKSAEDYNTSIPKLEHSLSIARDLSQAARSGMLKNPRWWSENGARVSQDVDLFRLNMMASLDRFRGNQQEIDMVKQVTPDPAALTSFFTGAKWENLSNRLEQERNEFLKYNLRKPLRPNIGR